MKNPNIFKGIWAIIRNKGQSLDSEMADELTHAYFGNEDVWRPLSNQSEKKHAEAEQDSK